MLVVVLDVTSLIYVTININDMATKDTTTLQKAGSVGFIVLDFAMIAGSIKALIWLSQLLIIRESSSDRGGYARVQTDEPVEMKTWG